MASLLAAVAMTFAATRSDAQTTLFWDVNGSTPGTGGTGNWLTTSTWRSSSSLGDWSDGNRANFGGTAGTVTLNGAVSATGVTFSTGGYIISGANSLTLTSTSTSAAAQAMQTTSSGTSTIDSSIILGAGASSTQTFSIGSSSTLVANGVISETNAGIILSKSGGGTLALFGNNSYTGGTSLTTGTIAVGSNTSLGTGALSFSSGTTLQSADANARTLSIIWSPGSGASDTFFGASGTGNLTLTDTTNFSLGTTVKTFTVNDITATISKVFTSGGSGNGLTKAGNGTLTLTGASTYTGVTKITSGTFLLGASERLADPSTMNLNGGTFSTGGFSETLGALTLSASSIIHLGDGASILKYGASNAISWSGTLRIYNYTGTSTAADVDQLFFGSNTSSLSQSQLDSIRFYSDAGSTLLGTGSFVGGLGQVGFTPVPEPSTGVGAGLILALVGWRQRKQLTEMLNA